MRLFLERDPDLFLQVFKRKKMYFKRKENVLYLIPHRLIADISHTGSPRCFEL